MKSFIKYICIGAVVLSLLGSFGSLIPLAIVGFVTYSIYKSAVSTNKKTKSRPANRKVSHLTARERQLIHQALTDYFQDNDRLLISGDISLRPQKGKYTTVRELYVYDKEDCVATMDEFQSQYDGMYNAILDLLLEFSKLDPEVREQASGKQTIREEAPAQTDASTDEYDNAREYIERINDLNTEITHEEITNGLYQMCSYLKHIEMIEQNFPNSKEKMRKVYHYYLPILIQILENYKQFSNSAQDHAEFKRAEDKLIKTIILINEALKNLSSTMCEEELLDLNANMSTLEMLLEKDGLVNQPKLQAMAKEQSHGK